MMLNVLSWALDLNIPWFVLFSVGAFLLILFFQIQNRWFPHAPVPTKSEPASVASGKRPHVVPVKSGWDARSYSGLFFKNNGGVPAYSIVAEPLQLGETAVEFTGPEATYLEPGDDSFLRLGNFPPSILMKNKPRGTSLSYFEFGTWVCWMRRLAWSSR